MDTAQNDAPLTTPAGNPPSAENAGAPSHTAARNIAVVQCEGFRCLAYQEAEVWRDFQTGKELPEVKSIIFTFSV